MTLEPDAAELGQRAKPVLLKLGEVYTEADRAQLEAHEVLGLLCDALAAGITGLLVAGAVTDPHALGPVVRNAQALLAHCVQVRVDHWRLQSFTPAGPAS